MSSSAIPNADAGTIEWQIEQLLQAYSSSAVGATSTGDIFESNQNKSANEQIGLALDKAINDSLIYLGDIAHKIRGVEELKSSYQHVNRVNKEWDPQAKNQQRESELNTIALNSAEKTESMHYYLANHPYGKELSSHLVLKAVDQNQQPLFYLATESYGNFISDSDLVKLDGDKSAILVYDKNGYFVVALDLKGVRNSFITDLKKGTSLSTTIAVTPDDKGKLEGYPAPLPTQSPPMITPMPEQRKDDGVLDNPVIAWQKGDTALTGPEIKIGEWTDNILTNENGDPAFKNGYVWKPDQDIDLRGTSKGFQEALDEAFERTGYDKSQFKPVRWSKTEDGKSIPVEYWGPRGAQVNVDIEYSGANVLGVPHIGYQVGAKGKQTGHILVDDVPANRYPDQPLEK